MLCVFREEKEIVWPSKQSKNQIGEKWMEIFETRNKSISKSLKLHEFRNELVR